jgi:hypothetical protein
MQAILTQAGIEIDADPQDRNAGMQVLDRFARATGPHLLAYDAHIIRQHQALTLYIRQCHDERDLTTIPTSPPN